MKMKKSILALAALAFIAWGCSSSHDDEDDIDNGQPNNSEIQTIPEGNDVRPEWQAQSPNFDFFEQIMTVDVVLQDTLQRYASMADLLCAKVGEEVRGVALPKEVNGQWEFPITVASNSGDEEINLYYYCERLHRIFSTYWTVFDSTLPPTGNDAVYRPDFIK